MADFPSRGNRRERVYRTPSGQVYRPSTSYRRRSSLASDFGCFPLAIAVIVICMIIGAIGYNITQINTHGTVKGCVVNNKDRTYTSRGQSDMRVYTDNCGVFSVRDTWFGKFNVTSADTFNSIKVGHTYDFDTRGYRFGLLSTFPIILTATEVAQ